MIQCNFSKVGSEVATWALFLNGILKQSPETLNTDVFCNLLIERLPTHEPCTLLIT